MNKVIGILLMICASCVSLQAQELNATVTVNSDRIQGTNKNVFTTLERALYQFINNQSWSSTTFSQTEKVECAFNINIVEQISDYSFKAELYVQSRRPVYNSSYITTLLNRRDTNFEFEYMENAPVEMVQSSLGSNLVAVIAFYCNLILAVDFDSFSPLGGSVFYRQAQDIATQAQSNSGWSGWASFTDNRNRTSIINSFNDAALKSYREFIYTYHRKGLDEMAANPDRARTTILSSLPVLKDIRNIRNPEIILQMFADCKLDEVVLIAGKATSEEKKETFDLLKSLFPTMSTQLDPLKK